MSLFSVTFVSNIEACRVEAEITDETETMVAIVYEDAAGCHLDHLSSTSFATIPDELVREIKAELAMYVNRTGFNAPEGLTRAGLALWLMLKDDGTAMGVPMK